MLDVDYEHLCPGSSPLACCHFHRHNDELGGKLVMMVLPAAMRAAISRI